MRDLQGCRVLLVEDESLVALMAESILEDLGCEVMLAMRLENAMALAQQADISIAVLDVNLGGSWSYPVADILQSRSIPFIFVTGYDHQGLQNEYRHVRTMQKPYREHDLADCIGAVLTDHAARSSSQLREASRQP